MPFLALLPYYLCNMSQWPVISRLKPLLSLTTSGPLQSMQLHRPLHHAFPDHLEVFWHKTEPRALLLLRNTAQVCFLGRGSVEGH